MIRLTQRPDRRWQVEAGCSVVAVVHYSDSDGLLILSGRLFGHEQAECIDQIRRKTDGNAHVPDGVHVGVLRSYGTGMQNVREEARQGRI
jgi:hypothetical protein